MAERSYDEVTNDTRFFATMGVHALRGPAATYGVLLQFMDEQGWCAPSKRTIAKLTGRSDPRNILRDLHWLVEKGLIETGQSTGGIHTAVQSYRIDLDRLYVLESEFRTLCYAPDVTEQTGVHPTTRDAEIHRVTGAPSLAAAQSGEAARTKEPASAGNILLAVAARAQEQAQAADDADDEAYGTAGETATADEPAATADEDVLSVETLADKIAKFGLGYNRDGAIEMIRGKWLPYIPLERIERELPLLVTAYGGLEPASEARGKVESYMEHVIAPLRKQRQIAAEKQELRTAWLRRDAEGESDDDPFSRVWTRHLDIACNEVDPTPAAVWWDWIKQAVSSLGEDVTDELLKSAGHVEPEERYALMREEVRVREAVAETAEHEQRMETDAAYAIEHRYGERMRLSGGVDLDDWRAWLTDAAIKVDAMTLANWHDDVLRRARRADGSIDVMAELADHYRTFAGRHRESGAGSYGDRRTA